MRSRFVSQRFIQTGTQPLLETEQFKFKGLNLVDPDEVSDANESPYAVNFRVFAPKDNTKRVAISKRKGQQPFSIPIGETITGSQQSVTGAAQQSITTSTRLAMPFTPGSSSVLTRVDLNMANTASGTGPVIVTINSETTGSPGTVLASSSISNASFTSSNQYITVRFIDAPSLTSGVEYWIVVYIQNDGTNNYKWASTTNASTAKISTDSGVTWSSAGYDLNYKFYYSTSGPVKGLHRYYQTVTTPIQLFAFGTNVYSVNDSTGVTTSVKSGLSSVATYYDFATVNNKEYFVNGVDTPQVYNASSTSVVGGSPPVASNVEVHANRLFLLSATDNNKLVFSDAGAYETFGATSFIYIPSPNTADKVQKIISYQNNLVCFNRNGKFVLYGTDLASFVLRESPAKKGASSPTAVASDGNFIYFLSDDGLYKFNGGTDILLSNNVEPLLANMSSFTDPKMWIFDNKVYLAYRNSGSSTKTDLAIFDIVLNTWLHDTGVNLEDGTTWRSQGDANRVIVGSSLVGQLMYGESGTSDIGKAIAFEYRTKYYSFDHPAAKHRLKRLYPHLRGQDGNYQIDVQIDVDEQNSPTSHLLSLGGATKQWGQAGLTWGQSGLVWGNPVLPLSRISVGGSNRKHQIRLVQGGVDNSVDFLGLSMYIKQQRPV